MVRSCSKRRLKNGEFSSVEKIVLNRVGDKYEKNTAKRNATAVTQFEELIDKAVNESKERSNTTADLPMIEPRGPGLSPDVFE